MEKLLEVKDLKVSFFTDLGETQAVKDAGFAIEEGDFFGIHKFFIDTPFTNGKHCAMIAALALRKHEC